MDKDTQGLILIILLVGIVVFITRKTSNKEEWEIVRDETGRLKNIIVHRDVSNKLR